MSICREEEMEKGNPYPRSCPTCGFSGKCTRKTEESPLTPTGRAAVIEECAQLLEKGWLPRLHGDWPKEVATFVRTLHSPEYIMEGKADRLKKRIFGDSATPFGVVAIGKDKFIMYMHCSNDIWSGHRPELWEGVPVLWCWDVSPATAQILMAE